MDSTFKPKPILNIQRKHLSIFFEKVGSLPSQDYIDICFSSLMKGLKPTMCSPLFSESDMVYCATEIQKLYPNLKTEERTQFETLNNRIKVWNQTRSDPAARFAKVESLPAYKDKKLKLLVHLTAIMAFEEELYGKLLQFMASTDQPSCAKEVEDTVLIFQKLTETPSSILESLKILKEIFPHLEFLLEESPKREQDIVIADPTSNISIKTENFLDAYNNLYHDTNEFKNYLTKLYFEIFGTFSDLIKTIKETNEDELKLIFECNTFEDFIIRLSAVGTETVNMQEEFKEFQ